MDQDDKKTMKPTNLILLCCLVFACEKADHVSPAYALIPALVVAEDPVSEAVCPSKLPPDGVFIADTVVDAPGQTGSGFGDSQKAVNGVCGGGATAGSTDVFSLASTGEAASMTLEWAGRRVYNGAGNDFIVFENPFAYTESGDVFIEALVVEVSEDGQSWCSFDPDYLFTPETDYSPQTSHWANFAGVHPTLYNQDNSSLSAEELFDPALSGGDHFDLENLSATDLFGTGCTAVLRDNLKNQGFLYLRLTSATDRPNPDSPGNNFPGQSDTADSGPDIDGVLSRYVSER